MTIEKVYHLRALGAEVIITRSDVSKGHPEYYLDVAKKIAIKNNAVHPKAIKPFFMLVSELQISKKNAPKITPII